MFRAARVVAAPWRHGGGSPSPRPETSFRIPDLYRRLVADGRTSYGATREEWKQTWRERSLHDPPALLIASLHVEWWSPEQIADYEEPDYWLSELRLIPFAQNGAGDVWCWHAASPGAEIVFAAHDENEAEVVAADLEGFLLRHMVLGLSEIYPDDGSDFTLEERVMSARANVRVLAPYLAPKRVALLEELCARPLVQDAEWGVCGSCLATRRRRSSPASSLIPDWARPSST